MKARISKTMKIFITGATGYIGQHLTRELVYRNYEVVALVRSKEKAAELAGLGVELVSGDLESTQAIEQAMQGAGAVFHLAAYAKIWPDDVQIYKKVNVEGTRTVLEAALKNNVSRVVVTSTAGVYGPSGSANTPVNENTQRTTPYHTFYEQTKAEAEALAQAYARKGLHVVLVNPTRVYGPGRQSESNPLSRLIRLYLEGKWHLIPGNGRQTGNYSFINDVSEGHILAMQKGRIGENYLLGGENASFNRFFGLLKQITGRHFYLLHVPVPLLVSGSWLIQAWAGLTGTTPLITPKWAKRYIPNWSVSSRKATEQLGYTITPLEVGLRKTINGYTTDE